MATVDFSGAYVHDATDLSSYVYSDSVEVKAKYKKPGKVEVYAGGRKRSVVGEAELQSVKVTFKAMTVANRETLEGWCGDEIMYRDGRGRMFYGVYHDISVKEIPGALERCEVTLTISDITKDIEV